MWAASDFVEYPAELTPARLRTMVAKIMSNRVAVSIFVQYLIVGAIVGVCVGIAVYRLLRRPKGQKGPDVFNCDSVDCPMRLKKRD